MNQSRSATRIYRPRELFGSEAMILWIKSIKLVRQRESIDPGRRRQCESMILWIIILRNFLDSLLELEVKFLAVKTLDYG